MTAPAIEGRYFNNPGELHQAIAEAVTPADLKLVFRDVTKTAAALRHTKTCAICHAAIARAREDDVLNDQVDARFVFSCTEADMRQLAEGQIPSWLTPYARLQVGKLEREQAAPKRTSLERHELVQQHKAAARSSSASTGVGADGERGVASGEATVDVPPQPAQVVDEESDPAPVQGASGDTEATPPLTPQGADA